MTGMCGKIDCYLQAFSRLHTDKNRTRWTAATCFRAPHKPFLLLSILDLIAQGQLSRSFIEPSFELAATFNDYWAKVMPAGFSPGRMAYPFFYMASEPFWHLVEVPGAEPPKGKVVSSLKLLRRHYLGARLDEELIPLLLVESLRERLRAVLIEKYFAPEIRPVVAEQGQVNYQAYRYGQGLLKGVVVAEPPADENLTPQARDQGFRKIIVALYDHRCALCGIRMKTPEGHTVVEAAHIVPWSRSRNDLPTNGLALCRLCHWSFDEGLMAIGKNYEVLISNQVKKDPNFPGHMLTLTDRPIFRPTDSNKWPGMENVAWHRREMFRR